MVFSYSFHALVIQRDGMKITGSSEKVLRSSSGISIDSKRRGHFFLSEKAGGPRFEWKF